MKKPCITLFLASIIFTAMASCSKKDTPGTVADTTVTNSATMKLSIGTKTFVAVFSNTTAAAAFKSLLPLTLPMSELNENEKMYDLPSTLPANAINPGSIASGDIMLYGTGTLVVFYKSFPTSYRYTSIARITDTTGLAKAVGTGSVTINFAN